MEKIIPGTADRVPKHTRSEYNERIYQRTLDHVRRYFQAPDDRISARLTELRNEWDIERVLEANASILVVASTLLAAFHSIWWLVLTGLVGAFLFQHALQGWCPPVPLFRRLGFRTENEICEERTALKYLRGDFEDRPTEAEQLLAKVQQS